MVTDRLMADISSNNTGFDAALYASRGSKWIAIKATEGGDYVDPYHEQWCNQAHAQDLAVLHYHFATGLNGSYTEQVNHFWRTVQPVWRKGDLLCLDIEREIEQLGPQRLAGQVNGMAQLLHGNARQDPVLYMNLYYHNLLTNYLGLRNRWFWIAAWGTVKPRLASKDRLWAWQCSNGEVGRTPYGMPGIGKCDVSEVQGATALKGLLDLARRR